MDDVFEAHMYSANHKEQLMQDSVCGCFYCGKIFNPSEITMWVKDILRNADIIRSDIRNYYVGEGYIQYCDLSILRN